MACNIYDQDIPVHFPDFLCYCDPVLLLHFYIQKNNIISASALHCICQMFPVPEHFRLYWYKASLCYPTQHFFYLSCYCNIVITDCYVYHLFPLASFSQQSFWQPLSSSRSFPGHTCPVFCKLQSDHNIHL